MTQITSLKLTSLKTCALPQVLAHATRSETRQTPLDPISPANARVRGATATNAGALLLDMCPAGTEHCRRDHRNARAKPLALAIGRKARPSKEERLEMQGEARRCNMSEVTEPRAVRA